MVKVEPIDRLQQLQSIVNRSPALVFVWRVEPGVWPVEFVSENVRQVLGYTADDFLSGRVSWVEITHPDDIPRLEKEVASLLERGRREFSQSYRLIKKSGEIVYMEDRNLVLPGSDGIPSRIQSIVLDVTQRKQVELQLEDTTRQLQSRQEELQRKNIALHEILAQIEEEKVEIRKQVSAVVDKLLLPVLRRLRNAGTPAASDLDLLETNLADLTSKFGANVAGEMSCLTLRQIEISNMIRSGMTSKQISERLHISLRTVETHRNVIRNKLGLSGNNINLAAHLHSLG